MSENNYKTPVNEFIGTSMFMAFVNISTFALVPMLFLLVISPILLILNSEFAEAVWLFFLLISVAMAGGTLISGMILSNTYGLWKTHIK